MTGTSQNSPIVVPRAATDPTPYIATAVAIAISKWLEDPMMIVMIASLYLSLNIFVMTILNPTTMANPKRSGIDTNTNKSGRVMIVFPFKENRIIKVVSKAIIDIFPIIGRYVFSNQSLPFLLIRIFLLMIPNKRGRPMKKINDTIMRSQFIGMF